MMFTCILFCDVAFAVLALDVCTPVAAWNSYPAAFEAGVGVVHVSPKQRSKAQTLAHARTILYK